MIKLPASLESVKTRKNVSDDILQTIVLNVWGSAEQIGKLNELYKRPLTITIEETK